MSLKIASTNIVLVVILISVFRTINAYEINNHKSLLKSDSSFSFIFNSDLDEITKFNMIYKYSNSQYYPLLDIPKKKALISLAEDLSEQISDKSIDLKALSIKAEYLFETGDFDSADSLFKLIKNSPEIESIETVLYKTYNSLYKIEERRGNFEKSFAYANEGLTLAVENNFNIAEIVLRDALAGFYERINRADLQISELLKALELAEKLKNYTQLSVLNVRIGKVYLNLGDFNKSLEYRFKGLEFAELSGNKIQIATAKHRLAQNYISLGKFEKALPLLLEAKEIRKNLTRKDRYAQILIALGDFYKKIGNYDSAQVYYTDALNNLIAMNHFESVATIHNKLASMYYSQNKLLLAKESLNNLINSIPNKNYFYLYRNYYFIMSRVEEKLGNYKASLEYYKKFKSASDSLKFQEQTRLTKFSDLEHMFELEKSKQQEIFNAQLSIKEEKIRFRNYLIIGSIFISAIFLGLLILLFRTLKKQKRSLRIIRNQNNDIKNKNIELDELNKIKNNYFTILAHDLRTPFSTILQLSEVTNKYIKEKELSEIQEVTSLLERSSKKFNSQLESTLQWGRIQIDGVKIFKEMLNLYEQVSKTITMINYLADEKEIKIINDVDDKIEVHSDKEILRTIILNLISNAIKFSERKELVKITASKINNSKVKLTISDNGTRFDKETLKNIFIDGSTTSKKGTEGETGFGFGLINSKKMIELNGGYLSIEDNKGKGSIVSFTLDLKSN